MYEIFAEPDSLTENLTAYAVTDVPTTVLTTVPTTEAPESIPEYLGYIACGVAVLFFGTNFIPVKQFQTGDGN